MKNNSQENIVKHQAIIKITALTAFTVIAYLHTFKWMVGRWTARDTYYSHGFLIPFISLFIFWGKRNILSKLKINPSNIGWLFFISGILIHAISMLWNVYFSSGFSLIFVLIGIVLLFFGKDYLKQLMFPILFLAFMIPLPMVAITNLSFRLKIFAAQISTIIIRKLGIPATREGSMIKTMHSQIMVEDPCSGIRSLIALIALGALMAYFSNISRKKKIILFISSVPIAIATNIIRIVTLSLGSEIYGDKFATGLFHNIMGILIFVFAFLGLVFMEKLLE